MAIAMSAEEKKETEKWNKAYSYEEYPRLLYRARKRPDGKVSVAESDDKVFGGNPGAAELWTNGCHKEVKNEDEHLKAKGQGWCDDQKSALEHFEKQEQAVAEVAAQRAYEDRNLGEKAKEEAKAVDDAAFEHVAEIKEKPKAKKPKKG